MAHQCYMGVWVASPPGGKLMYISDEEVQRPFNWGFEISDLGTFRVENFWEGLFST